MGWADQMSTYAWALGSGVGGIDFVVRIEGVACRHPRAGMRVKCTTHMNQVSPQHQLQVMDEYKSIWNAIETNHIFNDMSQEDSVKRCQVLDLQAETPDGLHDVLTGIGINKAKFFMRTA